MRILFIPNGLAPEDLVSVDLKHEDVVYAYLLSVDLVPNDLVYT